jgi:glycosyltransferase involved in cell wall biosynthesis
LTVTVIIPVHNRTALAQEAIASVATSAGSALAHETIVIDDGSDPDEARQLAAFCRGQTTCRYVRLDSNRGAQIARNEGLERASGRYIKFLDSDDILLPGALAEEFAALEEARADLLISGWLRGSLRDSNLVGALHVKPQPYAGNPYDAILSRFGAPISSVLYRATAIGPARWDPHLRHPDDWFFLIKVLLGEPRVVTQESPVFLWRDHAGPRLSQTSLIEYAYARFYILDHLYRVMQDRGVLTRARRQRLGNYLYRDIYVAHRFDRTHYQRLLARLDELDPAFAPGVDTEEHALVRLLRRLLGYRAYIPIHTFLRYGLPSRRKRDLRQTEPPQ